MDTNPTPEVTEQPDIEDRLASFFEDQPEAEEAPEATPEPEQAEEEIQPEATAEDDSEEVEWEGKAYLLPKELKGALLRQQDYTQKTQEVAVLRKQAEDKAQFVEAQQQFQAVVQKELGEYQALKARKAEFDRLDWSALYNADPGQAFNLRQQADGLKEQLAQKEHDLGEKARGFEQARQQHAQKQWALAVEAAKGRIGKFTAEEDIAMAQQAQALGFDESDLKGRFADARVLQALYKAAKWDSLQKGKLLTDKKVSTARPVKQVSRTGPQAQRDGALAEARQQLRKTGKDAYAEKILNAMFKE